MGLDQDLLGTSNGLETYNNFTAGVGFLLNGYRFDYAYHQYCSVSDNDTHYFSISYGLWKTLHLQRKERTKGDGIPLNKILSSNQIASSD